MAEVPVDIRKVCDTRLKCHHKYLVALTTILVIIVEYLYHDRLSAEKYDYPVRTAAYGISSVPTEETARRANSLLAASQFKTHHLISVIRTGFTHLIQSGRHVALLLPAYRPAESLAAPKYVALLPVNEHSLQAAIGTIILNRIALD